MSDKKAVPLFVRPVERLCPVCGKASYSQSGEHPQCSMFRLSAAFKARQKKRAAHQKQLAR